MGAEDTVGGHESRSLYCDQWIRPWHRKPHLAAPEPIARSCCGPLPNLSTRTYGTRAVTIEAPLVADDCVRRLRCQYDVRFRELDRTTAPPAAGARFVRRRARYANRWTSTKRRCFCTGSTSLRASTVQVVRGPTRSTPRLFSSVRIGRRQLPGKPPRNAATEPQSITVEARHDRAVCVRSISATALCREPSGSRSRYRRLSGRQVTPTMTPTNTIVRWNHPFTSGGIAYVVSELHHSTGDDTSLTKLMRIAAAFWAARS